MAPYARLHWPSIRIDRHHKEIIKVLHAVARGELTRVMIFMPPRHGKSEMCSRFFPAWYLGMFPDRYVITASYGQDLASDFGEKVRNLVADPVHREVFPNSVLSQSSMAKNHFTTTAGGAYFAVGVGGAIVGRGAHLLLIDDPYKGKEEAYSDVVRTSVWDWYTGSAYTRLMPGGSIIIINTRWHPDDLCGKLLEEEAEAVRKQGWYVLSLPALAEANDPLGRAEGEALWPEFYDTDTLEATREAVGPGMWIAQYQCRPVPEEGATFQRQWLKFYERCDPKRYTIYLFVDPASSKKQKEGGRGKKKKDADYTVFWVWGLGPDRNFYLLDVVRDRLDLKGRGDVLFKLQRKWRPFGTYYESYGLQADVEHFQDRMERENYRFSITELGGKLKKEDRIKRLVPYYMSGRIWLPKQLLYTEDSGKARDLVREFIDTEYSKFPACKFDDMLDCQSRILDAEVPLVWPREDEEYTTDPGPSLGADAWMAA